VRRGRALLHSVPLVLALSCGGTTDPTPSPSPTPTPCTLPATPYGAAVVESWLSQDSLTQNTYNDPQDAVGPPNAAGFGPLNYTGFVSLGYGGHVTLDLGGCVADQPGNDIRVYQAVSNEPLSVYVASAPDGPFTLLKPFFEDCGNRVPGTSNVQKYCEFDLASAGVGQARYVRVEDAEIYPCPCGTPSEGADLDAVQAMAVSDKVGAAEEPALR
jgi:hypothetical protein